MNSNLDTLIKSLRIVLTNIKIYPVNSPLVLQPLEELYSVIKSLFSEMSYVAISEMDGKMFINAEEYTTRDTTLLSHTRYLVQLFVQSGLRSITFKPGVSIDELKYVLIAMVAKKPKTTTKELIKQTLEEKNIKNISIDEVEFITVLSSEQQVKSILSSLSKSVTNLPDLMSMLTSVYAEFDKITNDTVKQQINNSVAKYVSSLDPQIIRDLFSNPLPEKIEQTGLRQMVFNNLTKEKVEEIFNEIIVWCKRLKSETQNETEYLDRLSNLKEFIKLVVNSPVSKLIPIEIFEELFKVGLIDILPEWVKERKESTKTWLGELEELLNTNDSTKLLQESFITSLKDNLENLCAIGLDDIIEKITVMMSENLQNPVVKLRQIAASSMHTIGSQLIKHNRTKIITKIVSNLLNLLLKEQDENIVNQYIETVTNSFIHLITVKEYSSFMTYAQQLIKISLEIRNVSPQKSKLIFMLFTKVFDSTKEILAEDLAKNIDEYTSPIIWFLNFMKDVSIDTLVSVLSKTENINLRKMVLQILKTDPNIVAETIKKYLVPQTPSKELHTIINSILELEYDFSTYLINLFNFTTYVNKIAIINYIYKKPTDENVNWLISLLDIEETQILEYVVDIITSLELKPAVPKLIKLLKTSNIDLKKRICISLGVLKDVTAIPRLKQIVLSKDKFFGIIKGEPLEVRLSAIWSLGNFVHLPEIKSLFKKLKNSKEVAIANSVKELLT